MTFRGLLSRIYMMPKIVGIACRSLRTGAYSRESKYLKYSTDFQKTISLRNDAYGLTVTIDECYVIYSSILATSNIEGAIAELGVYKGNTARLISQIKKDKELYLFDTFQGMPKDKISSNDSWEDDTHGDTSLASTKTYLQEFDNITFVPGTFPESIQNHNDKDFDNKTFSFVHLDVDLYQSTLDGLQYFYPRLASGGRIVSHNFNLKDNAGGRTPGVKKAFYEYFSGQEYKIIEIAETQCLVQKL